MTKKTKQTSQSEIAYKKLRKAITLGELQPGERLVENILCKRYNLGRTPIREAIRRLQNDDFLNAVPNKGVTVNKLSIEDVANIWSIIALMEGYATELGVSKLTAHDIEELKGLSDKMTQLTCVDDVDQYLEFNVLFHKSITQTCDNNHLAKLIDEFRSKIYRYRFLSVFILRNQEQLNMDHQLIVEAILNNEKPNKIGQIVRSHIERVRDISIELLKKKNFKSLFTI